MTSTVLLQFDAVSRTHGSGPAAVQALRNVSLTLSRGELVAVMGPSASGKSTLLNLAGGLDSPTSGVVQVSGVALVNQSAKALAQLRRDRVGYVFQDYNLIPALTASENVALPLELAGVAKASAAAQARVALEEVGADAVHDRFPEDMSGGQQQRVAIARGLIGSRELLLADEPTGALDSHAGEEILMLLRARCDAGAGCLMVTHEPRFAAWADRVIYLRDGEIVQSATPAASAVQS